MVACEAYDGAKDHGGWHENAMCGRTAEKTCYVRGGEADESYGAAEGCGRGCDETGEEVETAVHASGVDTEVLCVGIAKEYGVEWFYVEDGYYEAGKH